MHSGTTHTAPARSTHSDSLHSLTALNHCMHTLHSLHSLTRSPHTRSLIAYSLVHCTHYLVVLTHCTNTPAALTHTALIQSPSLTCTNRSLTHSLTHSLTQAGRARRAPWSALLPTMLQQSVRRNSTHTSGLVVEFSQTARDASRRECECFSWQRDGGVQNRALCRQSSWHSGATARQRLHDVVGQCILG